MVKLTIVIPIYNSENTLFKCLDSIPKRKDIELICCDDCSTDTSWNILSNWTNNNRDKFNNIIIYKNEENIGVGKTKKSMYLKASGEYIITIDSDDFVLKEAYSRAIDELYKPHKDNEMLVLDFCKNDGIRNNNYNTACASWRYFIKLKYLKDNYLMIHETRHAEDLHMLEEAKKLKTPPVKVPLHIFAYHYNNPRVGSLRYNWLKEHGK